MADKGILTKEEEKLFGRKVDGLVEWTKFDAKWPLSWGLKILEKKDSDLFTAMIKFLDDKYGEKIPLNLKPVAREVMLSIIFEDLDKLEKHAPELLNMVFDIPNIEEDAEAMIAQAIVSSIIDIIIAKAKK